MFKLAKALLKINIEVCEMVNQSARMWPRNADLFSIFWQVWCETIKFCKNWTYADGNVPVDPPSDLGSRITADLDLELDGFSFLDIAGLREQIKDRSRHVRHVLLHPCHRSINYKKKFASHDWTYLSMLASTGLCNTWQTKLKSGMPLHRQMNSREMRKITRNCFRALIFNFCKTGEWNRQNELPNHE